MDTEERLRSLEQTVEGIQLTLQCIELDIQELNRRTQIQDATTAEKEGWLRTGYEIGKKEAEAG